MKETISHDKPMRDKRLQARRRTRIRPVKLVSLDLRFLSDGAGMDRSNGGARVLRYEDRLIPPYLLVFDETENTLQPAARVWVRGREMGLRFCGPVRKATTFERQRFAGRYYAVPD